MISIKEKKKRQLARRDERHAAEYRGDLSAAAPVAVVGLSQMEIKDNVAGDSRLWCFRCSQCLLTLLASRELNGYCLGNLCLYF